MHSTASVFCLAVTIGFIGVVVSFPSWEGRTIDCTSQPGTCHLVGKDRHKYRCFKEPMPNQPSKTRISCPMACEGASRLSVVRKEPESRGCVQWSSYGKYWKYSDGTLNANETKYLQDPKAGDWYFWRTPKCDADLTTWCQFGY